MNEAHLTKPQWTTGPRLLKVGEEIEFDFYLPEGVGARDLVVFPQYLKRAKPGERFVADGGLSWLDDLAWLHQDVRPFYSPGV